MRVTETESLLSGALDRNTEMLAHVVDKLTALPSGLRQELADHLWRSIPETTFEYGYTPSGVSVGARAQTSGLRRITAMYTWCPSGQTGFVAIGNTTLIPVPSGPFYMGPIAIIAEAGDTRTLYSGVPGSVSATPALMFIGLWTQVLPRDGVLQ
jgi:hypothetical protein